MSLSVSRPPHRACGQAGVTLLLTDLKLAELPPSLDLAGALNHYGPTKGMVKLVISYLNVSPQPS